MTAMSVEEGAGDRGADQAGDVVQLRSCRPRPGPASAFTPSDSSRARTKTIAGVAQGEPEADRQRALALVHQLAGGVVDRRDVVGVEGVPHAQGVGGHADADAEGLGAEAVVLGRDDRHQGEPADDVQRHDERAPSRRAGSTPPGSSSRVSGASGTRRGRRPRWWWSSWVLRRSGWGSGYRNRLLVANHSQ